MDNVGQGSNVTSLVILETAAGARSTTGGPITIQSAATTDETCRVGDVCKFVNLNIQMANRPNVGAAENSQGWLEWAFVCVRENENQVLSTNLGLQNLGDICTNMYRGECIYTGNLSVGNAQPVVAAIKLMIPKSKRTIKLGDQWRFLTFFRAVSSIATGQTEMRLLKSYNYMVQS